MTESPSILRRRRVPGHESAIGGGMMRAGAGTVRRGRAAFSATPGDIRALLERLLGLRGITEVAGRPGRVPLS